MVEITMKMEIGEENTVTIQCDQCKRDFDVPNDIAEKLIARKKRYSPHAKIVCPSCFASHLPVQTEEDQKKEMEWYDPDPRGD